MYRLHYARLEDFGTGKDIPVYEFKKPYEMSRFIDNVTIKAMNRVFLLTKSPCEENEIFISECPIEIQSFVNRKNHHNGFHGVKGNYHLQEYCSFESAYAVAADMKEGNPLCYDDGGPARLMQRMDLTGSFKSILDNRN